jgi:glycosyltransferase involved in cell wall biosynthesis
MKFLILSFYKAYPPECGAATVTFEIFKHIRAQKYLVQLDRKNGYSLWGQNGTIQSFGPLPENKIAKGLWLLTKFPSILGLIIKVHADVIILEGAAWSLYNLGIVFGLKLAHSRSKLVYHAHNVEYLLRKEKDSALVAGISRWAEGILIKDCLPFAVSEVDARRFEILYGVKPGILANGVDPARFLSVSRRDINAAKKEYCLTHPLVLFMGLIGFKPNDEAARFLIDQVMPHLIQKRPDIKLAIIGGTVPYKRDWLINPGLIPYESLPSFIQAADICVAPVFSGSGTRLKILEYLAAGKPVVTTSKGAEGLKVRDGRDLIVADTEITCAASITKLMNDQNFAQRLGRQGRMTVEKNYSWEAIVGDFIRTLDHRY